MASQKNKKNDPDRDSDTKEETSQASVEKGILLYNELEKIMLNKPCKFSQMQYVANSFNRLDELGYANANAHRKVIFILILNHSVIKDGIYCKNKLPYHMEYLGKKRPKPKNKANTETSVTLLDEEKPVRCVLEKVPPTCQKILLAYTEIYLIESK